MAAPHQKAYHAIPGAAADELLFGGAVRLIGLGKHFPTPTGKRKKEDWSLREFSGIKNANEKETLRQHAVTRYLPEFGRLLGTKFFLAPSPRDSNAQICSSEDLNEKIEVNSPLYQNTAWLLRGKRADGLIVPQGGVYVGSPAGCPIPILRCRVSGLTGVMHAGLRSSIDEGRLKQELGVGALSRAHESVVFSLVEEMYRHGLKRASDLEVVIPFPIETSRFTYSWFNKNPEYRALNLKRSLDTLESWGLESVPQMGLPNLQHYGRIDLAALIVAQLLFLGVRRERIHILPSPPDWYTTRESRQDRLKRNLVFVQHL